MKDYTFINSIIRRDYLTYKQVADATGLSLSTVWRAVNGFIKNPRPETRKALDKYIKEYL